MTEGTDIFQLYADHLLRKAASVVVTFVVLSAVLIVALIDAGALHPGRGDGHAGRTLVAALAVSAAAIGAANSLREIVKEVPLYLKKRDAETRV